MKRISDHGCWDPDIAGQRFPAKINGPGHHAFESCEPVSDDRHSIGRHLEPGAGIRGKPVRQAFGLWGKWDTNHFRKSMISIVLVTLAGEGFWTFCGEHIPTSQKYCEGWTQIMFDQPWTQFGGILVGYSPSRKQTSFYNGVSWKEYNIFSVTKSLDDGHWFLNSSQCVVFMISIPANLAAPKFPISPLSKFHKNWLDKWNGGPTPTALQGVQVFYNGLLIATNWYYASLSSLSLSARSFAGHAENPQAGKPRSRKALSGIFSVSFSILWSITWGIHS